MAKKASSRKATATRQRQPERTRKERQRPTFPYTTRPNGLRRFLEQVPQNPRPQRVNRTLLASWGLSGAENGTIIRVLKTIGLVAENNEPTSSYTAFMAAGTGPAILGGLIRRVYAPLFEASHTPQREPPERLRNLFNIHSRGAASTMEFQIQTFLAFCEHADFDSTVGVTQPEVNGAQPAPQASAGSTQAATANGNQPPVHIDLHLHLPPGKTSREYEYIIQDIARYIYGHQGSVVHDREARS